MLHQGWTTRYIQRAYNTYAIFNRYHGDNIKDLDMNILLSGYRQKPRAKDYQSFQDTLTSPLLYITTMLSTRDSFVSKIYTLLSML